jgi:hypothetical protein
MMSESRYSDCSNLILRNYNNDDGVFYVKINADRINVLNILGSLRYGESPYGMKCSTSLGESKSCMIVKVNRQKS